MSKLQRLTGMRPAEVCNLRPGEVSTEGELMVYKPSAHKTMRHRHTNLDTTLVYAEADMAKAAAVMQRGGITTRSLSCFNCAPRGM